MVAGARAGMISVAGTRRARTEREARMTILVADYGMNVYHGGMHDLAQRLESLKAIGYDGLERLTAATEAQVLEAAATFRRLGCRFATVQAPTPDLCIRWSAAMGCTYVWASPTAPDLDGLVRQVNGQVRAAEAWGIRIGLHNHMGTPVESHEQVIGFLERCPEAGLVLDTAHLAAMGGDPVAVVREYPERVLQVHLKDWIAEREHAEWHRRGRFCELGAGNIGLDNGAVVRALAEAGYAGTVCVEQDTHLRDPLEDLAVSRRHLAGLGL